MFVASLRSFTSANILLKLFRIESSKLITNPTQFLYLSPPLQPLRSSTASLWVQQQICGKPSAPACSGLSWAFLSAQYLSWSQQNKHNFTGFKQNCVFLTCCHTVEFFLFLIYASCLPVPCFMFLQEHWSHYLHIVSCKCLYVGWLLKYIIYGLHTNIFWLYLGL